MILHFIDTQFQRTSLGRATIDEEDTQLTGTSLGRPMVSQGILSTPQRSGFKSKQYSELNLDFLLIYRKPFGIR